ncbi:MAG: hypothetical protein AB7P04_00270 [Bacteriovoracia bacterium]
MSEDTTTPETTAEAPKAAKPKTPKTPAKPKPNYSRKTLRKMARDKRAKKIREDKEFAKTYFAGKSKRSNDKKVAYRKRHSAGGAASA